MIFLKFIETKHIQIKMQQNVLLLQYLNKLSKLLTHNTSNHLNMDIENRHTKVDVMNRGSRRGVVTFRTSGSCIKYAVVPVTLQTLIVTVTTVRDREEGKSTCRSQMFV